MSKLFEALLKARQEHPELDAEVRLPSRGEDQLRAAGITEQASASLPTSDNLRPSNALSVSAPLTEQLTRTRVLPIHLRQGGPILPYDGTDQYTAEQYRIIRTKLMQHPRKPRVLLVSSPGPRDGKTITAINLAGALALRGEDNVVLIDADMRRSSIAPLLGLPEAPGLADVLAGRCRIDEVLIQAEQLPSLYIIPSGDVQANPAELLDSDRWFHTCAELKERFGFAVVDAPPVTGVTDYQLIQAHVDGIAIVVRPDHTNRAQCFKALETVPKDKLLGVTVNCAIDWFLQREHRHDHYYYYARPADRQQD